MDPRSLDAQQVLQGQRVAPFLERQHNFAHPEVFNKAFEIVDGVAVDRFFDQWAAIAHANKTYDNETRFWPLAQLAKAVCPVASTQYQNAPPEGRSAKNSANQQTVADQKNNRKRHGIGQG